MRVKSYSLLNKVRVHSPYGEREAKQRNAGTNLQYQTLATIVITKPESIAWALCWGAATWYFHSLYGSLRKVLLEELDRRLSGQYLLLSQRAWVQISALTCSRAFITLVGGDLTLFRHSPDVYTYKQASTHTHKTGWFFFFFIVVFCFFRQGFSVQPLLSWNLICRPGSPQTSSEIHGLVLPSAGIKVCVTAI